jgi:asparagine synthase (glutamine-hydrolysing)
VAEYAARLPITHKIRGIREKHVLREAAKDVLTAEVYDRHKHPFVSPPLHATADCLRDRVEAILRDARFQDQPFFDPRAVTAELDRLRTVEPADYTEPSRGLMMIASVALLQHRFRPAA